MKKFHHTLHCSSFQLQETGADGDCHLTRGSQCDTTLFPCENSPSSRGGNFPPLPWLSLEQVPARILLTHEFNEWKLPHQIGAARAFVQRSPESYSEKNVYSVASEGRAKRREGRAWFLVLAGSYRFSWHVILSEIQLNAQPREPTRNVYMYKCTSVCEWLYTLNNTPQSRRKPFLFLVPWCAYLGQYSREKKSRYPSPFFSLVPPYTASSQS